MNKEDWAAVSLLKNRPAYAPILEKFVRERYVDDYLNRRIAQGSYTHWYGFFFGVHKDKKLAAALSLKNKVEQANPAHKKAFADGELKRIYSLLH